MVSFFAPMARLTEPESLTPLFALNDASKPSIPLRVMMFTTPPTASEP